MTSSSDKSDTHRHNPTDLALPGPLSAMLIVSNLLFLTLALTLAWCNRLSGDDFAFLARAEQYGVLGSVTDWWRHWTGRWASALVIACTVLFVNEGRLFVYNLITIVGFVLSLWTLLHRLFHRYLGARLTPLTGLNLAVFLSGVLFFVDGHRGETWYWLSGSATYLQPLGFPFVAAALIAQSSFAALLVSALLFGLAAGCNESIAFLTLVLLSGVLGAVLWKSCPMFREAWKPPMFHRACWPFLISLASSAALYFAPGNQVRRAFFPRGSTFTAILLAWRGTTHILQFYLTHRALLLGLAVVLGWIVRPSPPTETRGEGWPRPGRSFLALSAITYGAVFLSVLPAAIGEQGCPPQRAWEQISVLLVGAAFIAGLSLAQTSFRFPSGFLPGAVAALCLMGGMAPSLVSLARQYPVVRRYAASFDARYQRLLDHRRSGDTREVRLDPLGSSGWLPSAEIPPDPTHWRNQEVRDGMSLRFPVRLK